MGSQQSVIDQAVARERAQLQQQFQHELQQQLQQQAAVFQQQIDRLQQQIDRLQRQLDYERDNRQTLIAEAMQRERDAMQQERRQRYALALDDAIKSMVSRNGLMSCSKQFRAMESHF